MAELTAEQKAFLRSHKISLGDVFDASGMRRKDYIEAMKQTGHHFAYGVSPCGANGHTLRTRAGHCIQCNHSVIAHATLHSKGGIVYLAGSARKKLLKVGATSDRQRRLSQLNEGRYGGAFDWEMLAWASVKEAGRVEYEIQDRLQGYSCTGSYMHDGREQECYELFTCGYKAARAALSVALPSGSVIHSTDEPRLLAVYDFEMP